MQKDKYITQQLPLFELPQQQKKSVAPKKRERTTKNSKSKNEDELKKTHHTHPQYKNTVANADKYIQQLLQLSLDKLVRNLDIIREQMQIAFKKKKYASYELLYEWEQQALAACVQKIDMEGNYNKKNKRGK